MTRFKAIIVGGGPVGMIMAHALSLADIDFILVEKRDTISTWTGAGLTMWPQGMRILHQMGLREALIPVGVGVDAMEAVGPGGSTIASYPQVDHENFGYSLTGFERGQFLEVLYRNLPRADDRIKTNKRVSGIAPNDNGVVVMFDDGTSEEGSIVIGVDGVWSTIRHLTAALAPLGAIDEKPWKGNYLCAYGRGKYIKGFPERGMVERNDNGWGFQGLNHMDQFIWLLFKRVPETQSKSKYSKKDEESFWEDMLDQKIYKNVTGRDIWSTKTATGLTMLDQGTAKSWYWDRVVLLGDANHKPTPNVGAGVVAGAEAAIVLTNRLYALLQAHPEPNTEQLTEAFAAYQSAQEDRAKFFVFAGNMMLDKITWRTWFDWFSAWYIDPWLRVWLEKKVMLQFVAKSPMLDFVPFEDEFSGTTAWNYGKETDPPPKSWLQIITGGVRSVFGFASKEKST